MSGPTSPDRLGDLRSADLSAASAEGEPPSKIRRTTTACQSCRKVKTRCEVPPFGAMCRRCKNLGIQCVLPDCRPDPDPLPAQAFPSVGPDSTPTAPGVEERLQKLEAEVRELKLAQLPKTREQAVVGPELVVARESDLGADPVHALGRFGTVPTTNTRLPVTPGPSQIRPVKLIRSLQHQFFGAKADFSSEVFALGNVVTAGIVRPHIAGQLLELFLKHFGFWLSFTAEPPEPERLYYAEPLLFSTCCLIASRFVPQFDRETIYEIYGHVRRLASSALLNMGPLYEDVIRSYVLLCFWSPTVQAKVPLDTWLLSSMAANQILLALDLNLDLDNDNSPQSSRRSSSINLYRLWACLCILQLQYSIGNGRPLSLPQKLVNQCSRQIQAMARRSPSPPSSSFDHYLVAELNLYWSLYTLLNDEDRLVRLDQDQLDMSEWTDKWQHLLSREQGEGASLTSTSRGGQSPLSMGLWYSRLLLRSVRLHLDHDNRQLRDECIDYATLILTGFVQTHAVAALGYSDHSFFIIAYAALALYDLEVEEGLDGDDDHNGNDIPHPLTQAAVHQLMAVAANDEHIAYRHACVIQRKMQRQPPQRRQQRHQSQKHTSRSAGTVPVPRSWDQQQDQSSHQYMPPFSRLSDLDGMDDLGFDASFVNYQI